MKFKEGINTSGVRPELVLALIVADGVYRDVGKVLVVTSVSDGVHSRAS